MNLNLGHQHPDLVEAIQRQAGRLATIQPSMANDVRGELARRIAEVAPEGMEKVFFTNGGADANENAVRMARIVTGRRKVLSMYRSYHGNTTTAIALTGDPRRWPNEPADGSVAKFFGPYPYRSRSTAASPEEESQRALEHLEQTIILEGATTIAAIVIETIVGHERRAHPAARLPRRACGSCATGSASSTSPTRSWWASAGSASGSRSRRFDVVPDLITFAKGVNSGYVPLGGVVISDRHRRALRHRVFPGGLTYSGHPLACAAGVATFEVFERDGILERVRDLGDAGRRAAPARHGDAASVASATCAASACSGRSSSCATARRASRSCRSTPAERMPHPSPRSPQRASATACGRSRTSTACTSRRRS